MLSIALLGDFCISNDNVPVKDIDTSRLQSFFAYLLLHKGAPQLRSHLAFLFWPDTEEAQARTNLRNLLHHLRHALPDAEAFLEINGNSLQWNQNSSYTLDVEKFRTELVLAQRVDQIRDTRVIRQALEHAVDLYKGDLLPSCYDDWIIPQRELLRQEFINALEQLIFLLEEQREYRAAILNAHRLLQFDPLHEATYRCLIRLYALNDDRASALRIFHSCTTILKRELDVEPSYATQEAYEQLLGLEVNISTMEAPSTAFSPLIGRADEWTCMLSEWRSVLVMGSAHFLMLRGEAGIGKTRLVEELLQWASRQGIVNASARCYAAEGNLAYAPISSWLRTIPLAQLDDIWLVEVARLLPEVLNKRPDLSKPVDITEEWHRQHLFEAISRAILGLSKPTLLILDDLQWCDRDTIEWLHFFLRYATNAKLMIVGTYRPEEIRESHPLIPLLQALRIEDRISEIELNPLDCVATRQLASILAGEDISGDTAQWIYHETEGNPFFIVEMVHAGLPDFTPRPDDKPVLHPSQNQSGVPVKVWSLLTARLAQLSPPALELARLAATIGREFSFMILHHASENDENILIRQLDELWKRRIIREHGTDSYDFSHDKLREAAYESMHLPQKRLFHKKVAQTLEKVYIRDLNPVCHQIAVHYEHAGLVSQSLPFYLQAADIARQVFANDEAINLLQHGLMLIDNLDLGVVDEDHVSELSTRFWESLGDIFELQAQHEKALNAYYMAQSQLRNLYPVWQARLNCKLSIVFREQRRYSDALEACNQAELALGSQAEKNNDNWWDQWLEIQVTRVWAYYWLARWHDMELLVNTLQPVVQARGKQNNRMHFLMASCLMHLRRERYRVSDQLLVDIREALAASQDLASKKYELECQFELGFLHLWRYELDEAREKLLMALELAETSGNLWMQTLCLTYLTVLYRFKGQMDEVIKYAQRSQRKAEEAQMPDYIAAAKGNKAWYALRKQDYINAQQYGQEALHIWKDSPLVYPFQWQALWSLIIVAIENNQEEVGWCYIEQLLDPTQQLLPVDINKPLENVLEAKNNGQLDDARNYLDRAISIALEIGYL